MTEQRAMTDTEAIAHARAVLQSGNAAEAEAVARQMLAHDSGNVEGAQILALCLARRGALAEALPLFETVVRGQPGNAGAHNNLGNVLSSLARHAEALASFDAAIAIDPHAAVAHGNRGNALKALGRYDEALASYASAIAVAPEHGRLRYNRGTMLMEIGRHAEALADLDRAVVLDPREPSYWLNRGSARFGLRRFAEALSDFDRAIELDRRKARAHAFRASCLREVGRPDDALAAFSTSLALEPDLPYVLGDWVMQKLVCCDWNGLPDAIARVMRAIDRGERASTPFALLALPSSREQQRACARAFVSSSPGAEPSVEWPRGGYSHDRLRIGYFSADFHDHATAHLLAGVLEQHDRARFEITAFSFGPDAEDPWRRRIASAVERFVEVRNMADAEIAAHARALEIDIAVDLKGHTQHARMAIFAARAAPVQAGWLGYPSTTGARYIDYVIADRVLIPESHRESYDEKIAYLPHCYQPNDSTKAMFPDATGREAAGLPATGFVFGCFNHSFKILPEIFDVWMRLLRAVERSVLWLLESNHAAVRNLRAEALARGIYPERLVFAPRVPLAAHLARHRHADLMLDTIPYNAHTTASDALWAGAPMVTCIGETFAGRVGASLLDAIGLPELIAADLAAYEALALELAREPARLAAVRAKLAANRTSMPLFDTVCFTRDLEALFATMVERQRAGTAPAHLLPQSA
jgi:predicted O-linked N-acetylglucosamine transferase (SPINDLY family)